MTSLGFDPVWFGVLIVMVIQIGLISPPVGMNLFVLSTLLPQVKTGTVFRGVLPFVLMDCPPSLSLLTLNGLCAAQGVIVPMQCEYFALEGLSDLVNTIKQAREFGITSKVVAMLVFTNNTVALGLDVAQGIRMAVNFYWDANDETRAWSKRYFEKERKMPNHIQAGVYGAVMHYLKAVKAAGTDAELVPNNGTNVVLSVRDAAAPGGRR
mgnify:CR=1 FL=1